MMAIPTRIRFELDDVEMPHIAEALYLAKINQNLSPETAQVVTELLDRIPLIYHPDDLRGQLY